MKHFSEIGPKESGELFDSICRAMVDWAKRNDISGLSEKGSHNLYESVTDMIIENLATAKKAKGK